mgnify:CR=1 FL=1
MSYDPENPLNVADAERQTVKDIFNSPNFQTKAVAIESIAGIPSSEVIEPEASACPEKSA